MVPARQIIQALVRQEVVVQQRAREGRVCPPIGDGDQGHERGGEVGEGAGVGRVVVAVGVVAEVERVGVDCEMVFLSWVGVVGAEAVSGRKVRGTGSGLEVSGGRGREVVGSRGGSRSGRDCLLWDGQLVEQGLPWSLVPHPDR